MRKRSGRPPRFAAVPNETIDDAASLDFMALALLTVMLRHQDGWEITLAEVGAKYGYGRDALAKAMGLLQVARYVVKVRTMAARDRQWSTEVIVYDTPASDGEVAELLEHIARDPEVRTVQVIPPTAAAVEHAAKRREKLGPKRREKAGFSLPPRQAAASDAEKGSAAPGQAAGGGEADTASPARPEQPRKAAGSAAAGKRSKAKESGRRLSKEQAAALREVEEAFPEQLLRLLPKYRPPVLRDAILEALESRSAAEVAVRVRRRWWSHGYAADTLPDGKGITSPVGVAVGLVRPSTDCPEPMCEDGTIIDTGADCRACVKRKGDRRGQKRVPEQREPEQAGERWWDCAECRDPRKGERPADGLCAGCRAEAEAAAAAVGELQGQFEAERERRTAAQWAALMDEAYAEHERREAEAAERRALAEAAEERRRAEQEETRRLREQLAREHPELAQYAQT